MQAKSANKEKTTSFTSASEQKMTLTQKVLENFYPRYASQASILALNDPEQNNFVCEQQQLNKLGITLTTAEALPDLLLYQEKQQTLFFIEIITSHGIITTEKRDAWECDLTPTRTKRVYVSIFHNLTDYAQHILNIAWGSYCWIADEPGHTILHW